MAHTPPPWRRRLEDALGPVHETASLGGEAHLVEAGGRALVAKPGEGALDEAAGLRAIGAVPGAPPVPEVVLADEHLLVTAAVAQSERTSDHVEHLGRSLAQLHSAPHGRWGGGSSWIGACPVTPATWSDGASFYGARLHALAARCALERSVTPIADHMDALMPSGGPALVHGDLWWGNVLFGSDGRAWVIDPSVHGGHPEEDLAMLALFGPLPDRLVRAYDEVRPLARGWRERLPLFQLVPLLVHCVLFGGGYRAQVEAACRQLTR